MSHGRHSLEALKATRSGKKVNDDYYLLHDLICYRLIPTETGRIIQGYFSRGTLGFGAHQTWGDIYDD